MRLASLVEYFCFDVLFELGLEVVIILQLQFVIIALVVLHSLGGALTAPLVFDWLDCLTVRWLLIQDWLAGIDAWTAECGFHEGSRRDVGVRFLIIEWFELWLVHVLERGEINNITDGWNMNVVIIIYSSQALSLGRLGFLRS